MQKQSKMRTRQDDLQAAEQKRQDALRALQGLVVERRAKLASLDNTNQQQLVVVVSDDTAMEAALRNELEDDRDGRLDWPSLVANKVKALQDANIQLQRSKLAWQRLVADYQKQFGLSVNDDDDDENIATKESIAVREDEETTGTTTNTTTTLSGQQ